MTGPYSSNTAFYQSSEVSLFHGQIRSSGLEILSEPASSGGEGGREGERERERLD